MCLDDVSTHAVSVTESTTWTSFQFDIEVSRASSLHIVQPVVMDDVSTHAVSVTGPTTWTSFQFDIEVSRAF